MSRLQSLIRKISDFPEVYSQAKNLPRCTVNLAFRECENNDPFYARITQEFYALTQKRYPLMPMWTQFSIGVALCDLTEGYDAYFSGIESSGRRNVRKAIKQGYEFSTLDYNSYLDDIQSIHGSTEERQGKMPDSITKAKVLPISNPASQSNSHDYAYFGVLKDDTAYAYAGCLIAGELCMLETIYGHSERMSDQVVPMLVAGIAEHVIDHYPGVKYYGYGTYFGASESMQRFKRKFGFKPQRVSWKLGK